MPTIAPHPSRTCSRSALSRPCCRRRGRARTPPAASAAACCTGASMPGAASAPAAAAAGACRPAAHTRRCRRRCRTSAGAAGPRAADAPLDAAPLVRSCRWAAIPAAGQAPSSNLQPRGGASGGGAAVSPPRGHAAARAAELRLGALRGCGWAGDGAAGGTTRACCSRRPLAGAAPCGAMGNRSRAEITASGWLAGQWLAGSGCARV